MGGFAAAADEFGLQGGAANQLLLQLDGSAVLEAMALVVLAEGVVASDAAVLLADCYQALLLRTVMDVPALFKLPKPAAL